MIEAQCAEGCSWGLSNPKSAQELETWFHDRGIDTSRPGIHDSPAFLRVEAQDPTAMNMVARYIEARSYSQEELLLAERKILVAVKAISQHIARDGRLGKCVVASCVLSRCLDELGVWNYTAMSSLTIRFPEAVSATPQYFYAVDQGDFAVAHAVVVAPPFAVIDLTIRHQHFRDAGMTDSLPSVVLMKEFQPYRMPAVELVSPEVSARLRICGYPTAESILERQHPEMLQVMSHLPSREASFEGTRMSYGIFGVAGYAEPLSEITSHNAMINGWTPKQIFVNDILPKI